MGGCVVLCWLAGWLVGGWERVVWCVEYDMIWYDMVYLTSGSGVVLENYSMVYDVMASRRHSLPQPTHELEPRTSQTVHACEPSQYPA